LRQDAAEHADLPSNENYREVETLLPATLQAGYTWPGQQHPKAPGGLSMNWPSAFSGRRPPYVKRSG
jgi:hypothetical protein